VLVLAFTIAGCRPVAPAGTLFYASGADLQSINPLVTTHPLAKQVQRYVLFMTLVRYDSALVVRPWLADSWTWSADRRALTLKLRDDVKWHDGVPTTAADVVFTLEAARDPATGYPRGAEVACIQDGKTARRQDGKNDVVILTFCRPQDRFPDVLTDLAILPEHLLGGVPHADLARAAFNEHPVGNGPFRFVRHEPDRRWVFARNPEFPSALGGPPAAERLVIVVVDEATTKLAGLVSRELDFAGINPMHASVVRRAKGLAVLDYPLLLTYGIVWNTSRVPFNDPRLRRALTLALDRRQMVDAYVYGFGEIANGPVPRAHPLVTPVPAIPFDHAHARALLDSLGWNAGHPLAFTLTTVGTADNVLEQLIQANLAAVGVEVRIRQMETGAFLAAAQGRARDYDAIVTGITGDLALGYLGALFDSRRLAGPLQYAQYRNAAVDSALDRGDFASVQRIVATDLPITFIYHARGVQGINTRVTGVRMDLRGELAGLSSWHLVGSP
jgi:peptide/nickel transport system substrate-binding protein